MTRAQRWTRTIVRIAVILPILLIFLSYFAPLTLPRNVHTYTGTCVQMETFVIGSNRNSDIYHGILTFEDGKLFYLNDEMIRQVKQLNFDDTLPTEQVTVRYTRRTSLHREGAQRVVGLSHGDTVYVSLQKIRRSAVTSWIIFGSFYLMFAVGSILFTFEKDRTLFADRIKKQKKLKARAKAQKQQEREARRQVRTERRHARKK